jgi:hypothetical protein
MNNKTIVLGSGSIEPIDNTKYNEIYCSNSSFTRLLCPSKATVVASDAFLYDENMLNNLPVIEGLSRDESNTLRLKKYSLFNSIEINKLLIIDGPIFINKKNERLKNKHINSKISFVSNKDKWKLFKQTFSLRDRFLIFYNIPGVLNKVKFCIQYMLSLKMSLIYRPSIGIICLMIALKDKKDSNLVFVDGITSQRNSEKSSIYDGQMSVKFGINAHYIDHIYYDIMSKLLTTQANST